ncbi:hypothetical protein CVT25_003679, partial [Psilocybe cyanescens]
QRSGYTSPIPYDKLLNYCLTSDSTFYVVPQKPLTGSRNFDDYDCITFLVVFDTSDKSVFIVYIAELRFRANNPMLDRHALMASVSSALPFESTVATQRRMMSTLNLSHAPGFLKENET